MPNTRVGPEGRAGECDCPRGEDGWRRHPADCPAVAFIKDTQKRLLPSLIEMDRVRRRGAAEARNHVIC